MKATEVFFDQLEQEIKSGTFVKPQKEDAKLPPLPTKEGKTLDYTELRKMIRQYQETIAQLNNQIATQSDALNAMTKDLEAASDSLKQKELDITDLQVRLNKKDKDIKYYCDREKLVLLQKANAEEKLNEKIGKLATRNEELESWYSSWKEIRDTIAAEYDSCLLEEAGGMDDISAMSDLFEKIMTQSNTEKQLRNEIARLKSILEKQSENDRTRIEIEIINKAIQEMVEIARGWELAQERSQFSAALLDTCDAYMTQETRTKVKLLRQARKPENSLPAAMGNNNGIIAGGDIKLGLSKEGETELINKITLKSK